MALNQRLETLLHRYRYLGEPLRYALNKVLPAVFPGSRELIELLDEVLGMASTTWRDYRQVQVEERLARGDAQRLDALLAIVQEELGELVSRVSALGQARDEAGVEAAIQHFATQHHTAWQRAQTRFDELALTLAEVKTIGLSLQNEMATLGRQQQDFQDQALALLQQVEARLAQLPQLQGALSPQASWVLTDPREQRQVHQWLASYRHLPVPRRAALPTLGEGLAKLALGVGDPAAAEATFLEVDGYLTDAKARAETQYNAFRAALEQALWERATAHLQAAIALDPERVEPFPLRKYQLERVLGAGGFGVVFLATHRRLARPVVIKTLYDEALARSIDDIMAEAQLLMAVDDPAVIRLIDADDEPIHGRPRPHLVMEYFEGESLEALLQRQGPLPAAQFLPLALTLARALTRVHGQGVLHRDLKPGNILVQTRETPWLCRIIDFGLALDQRWLADVTRGRSVLATGIAGTLDYAPPEQLGRSAAPMGPHSDVYAFAGLCARALVGVAKPRARDWQRFAVPAPLVELLEDALAEAVDERPANFAVVAARLEALLTDSPA
ncbi:MAG: protein kinase, partial [Candidatus Competibacterales bacterium]